MGGSSRRFPNIGSLDGGGTFSNLPTERSAQASAHAAPHQNDTVSPKSKSSASRPSWRCVRAALIPVLSNETVWKKLSAPSHTRFGSSCSTKQYRALQTVVQQISLVVQASLGCYKTRLRKIFYKRKTTADLS